MYINLSAWLNYLTDLHWRSGRGCGQRTRRFFGWESYRTFSFLFDDNFIRLIFSSDRRRLATATATQFHRVIRNRKSCCCAWWWGWSFFHSFSLAREIGWGGWAVTIAFCFYRIHCFCQNWLFFRRWMAVLIVIVITVLGLHMSSQIYLSLEGTATVIAREGFVAWVLSGVRDQIGRLGKCLPTHCTFVWFLTWGKKQEKSQVLLCYM